MSDPLYQLVFDGRLRPGITPDDARASIGTRFRLNERQVERLFSGRPVTVKRKLDASDAQRYQRAFLEAGAIVEVRPLESATTQDEGRDTATSGSPQDADLGQQIAGAGVETMFQLLPVGATIDGQTTSDPPVAPDTSRLSLAPREASSLEDCAPTPAAPPTLDLSRYELLPPDSETPENGDSN